MTEQLQKILDNLTSLDARRADELGLTTFALLLVLSVAASSFIALLYLRFYSSRGTGSQLHRSFPLLGLSVTAIFICIQFSLPLSLGLLGALSIVRFRTAVKEPEEVGFIMLVIASALSCATFNLAFLVGILTVASATLVVARGLPRFLPVAGPLNDGSLLLAVSEEQYRAKGPELFALVERTWRRAHVESISKSDAEVVLSFTFNAVPPQGLPGLEAEIRKIVDPSSFTIVYNRPAAL